MLWQVHAGCRGSATAWRCGVDTCNHVQYSSREPPLSGSLSMKTPRSRTFTIGVTDCLQTIRASSSTLESCCRVPIQMNSVFEAFSLSRLELIHDSISDTQANKRVAAGLRSEMVQRTWPGVTRPSVDYQTIFLTFQPKWQNFLKVAERSHDSRRTVTPPSADFQAILFRPFSKNAVILKIKIAERSRDIRQRSGDRRPTITQQFSTFQAKWQNLDKKSLNGHATVVGRSRDRRRQALLVLLLPNRLNTAPVCLQQRCLTCWISQ